MASATELVAIFAIVFFVIGASFGIILIVSAGIKAEENVARKRHRARMDRSTTLYDEPTSAMTRGVRQLTGSGHNFRG